MKQRGFLLIEIVVSIGILMLFCSIAARYQRIAWFLHRESMARIVSLDRLIDSRERGIKRTRRGVCGK